MGRICTMCGAALSKRNTGKLGWIQPTCNRCLPSFSIDCKHILSDIIASTCILCGLKMNIKSKKNKDNSGQSI